MRDLAIIFACWLAYAVAKKQAWIDPPTFLNGEAPWWAQALAVIIVATYAVIGIVSVFSTLTAARAVSKARK